MTDVHIVIVWSTGSADGFWHVSLIYDNQPYKNYQLSTQNIQAYLSQGASLVDISDVKFPYDPQNTTLAQPSSSQADIPATTTASTPNLNPTPADNPNKNPTVETATTAPKGKSISVSVSDESSASDR